MNFQSRSFCLTFGEIFLVLLHLRPAWKSNSNDLVWLEWPRGRVEITSMDSKCAYTARVGIYSIFAGTSTPWVGILASLWSMLITCNVQLQVCDNIVGFTQNFSLFKHCLDTGYLPSPTSNFLPVKMSPSKCQSLATSLWERRQPERIAAILDSEDTE